MTQAGTVVTASKSLFKSHASSEPVESFQVMSRALKGMELPHLGMAMVMAKLTGNHLQLSSAGMPPALIYRASSGAVEEILLEGIPLGYVTDPEYETHDTELEAGDTVLLMSDGFPERMNGDDEQLDYPRAQELFRESAHLSPDEICQRLTAAGDEWAAGREQDDDVSFVALKMRSFD